MHIYIRYINPCTCPGDGGVLWVLVRGSGHIVVVGEEGHHLVVVAGHGGRREERPLHHDGGRDNAAASVRKAGAEIPLLLLGEGHHCGGAGRHPHGGVGTDDLALLNDEVVLRQVVRKLERGLRELELRVVELLLVVVVLALDGVVAAEVRPAHVPLDQMALGLLSITVWLDIVIFELKQFIPFE